jgi:hypothetical protein
MPIKNPLKKLKRRNKSIIIINTEVNKNYYKYLVVKIAWQSFMTIMKLNSDWKISKKRLKKIQINLR